MFWKVAGVDHIDQLPFELLNVLKREPGNQIITMDQGEDAVYGVRQSTFTYHTPGWAKCKTLHIGVVSLNRSVSTEATPALKLCPVMTG